MVGFHSVVGTLVVLGYLMLTVLNVAAIGRGGGRVAPLARPLSYAAAALLLLQYAIGFALIGSGYDKRGLHYVLALSIILTIGFEHGFARTRAAERHRALFIAAASALTTVLLVLTYIVGQSGS